MVQALFYGVIALNLGYVVFKKKSALIALLSVAALSLVMGYAGTLMGDLNGYKTVFETNVSDYEERFEMGYLHLNDFFAQMGFDFDQFRIALFLLCALLIYFTVRSITKEYNLIVLLYTLVLFYFFSVALRFFVAFAIGIFACRFLLKDKWYHIPMFVGLVLLAAQFHKSLYVLLLFAVCLLPGKALKIINKVFLLLSGLSLVLAVYMLAFPGDISYFADIFNAITSDTFTELSELSNSYFGGGYSRIYVLYILFYVFGVVCTYFSLSYLWEKGLIEDKVMDKIWCIQLIGLIISPAILLSQTIMRLIFIPVFIGFLTFGKAFEHQPPLGKGMKADNLVLSTAVYKILVIGSALTWFVKLYLIGDLGFNLTYFLNTNTLV